MQPRYPLHFKLEPAYRLGGGWPTPCAIGDGAVTYHATLDGRPLTGSEPAPSLHRLALSQSFTRDTTAPVIGNLSPVNGSVIKQDDPVVQLTGQTNDSAAITVLEQSATLNAQGANPQIGQYFLWSITLQPGQNTAALTSLDPAGNGSTTQTTVTYIPTGSASWRFSVPIEGRYDISARWVGQGTPAIAVYRIQHADGSAAVTATPGATAVLALGAYRFLPGITYAVTLDSRDGDGTMVADAISASPQDAGYNIHPDQLGTPRVITDAAGQVVWRWELDDPYGANPATGPLDMPLRFPGQYLDTESNLHYNVFRDYDPNAGRYEQSDPIGLMGGINTYSYALQNPLKYTDPLGLDAEMCNRPIQLRFIPGQHCFMRFNGDDGDTSSFDLDGVHPDPAPKWASCEATQGPQNDDCIKREMKKCQNYDFIKNNCCHCAEQAIKACGQSIPVKSWPN